MSISGINKVPIGISNLDEVIGGKFPKGSLIVLAGNPGTGKTIFSATSLYNSIVNYGEKGVYASFSENREAFFNNMLNLGLDFEKLENEGKFRFLDLLTTKEIAIPSIINAIIDEVEKIGANHLVIDSFSALAQAFKEMHEVRIILHTILSKITKSLGCTTILIIEVPYGESKIGLGIEEFVADGIILLKRELLDGRVLRELEVLKMRGSPIFESKFIFTLKDGFKVFSPFKVKLIEKLSRFESRQDTKEYFSTGSQSLDEMLGGGYPRGSGVLIEISEYVSTLQYHLISVPTAWNFGAQGRGVMIIPSHGIDPNIIIERAKEGGMTEDEINRLLRIFVMERSEFEPKPYLITYKGEKFKEDYTKYVEIEQELMKNTGQPVLHIVGVDTLIDLYGVKGAIHAIRNQVTRIREMGGLGMALLKPGYPTLAKILSALADVHLRITRRYGTILIYGIKPRTNIYALKMDISRGYPMPKLTQII
ncbi:MAG: ATPase domain-containing protein [Nitrososphaerales archaeon]